MNRTLPGGRPVPAWLSRMLKLPGSTSFARFAAFAREAGEREGEVRRKDAASLAAAAAELGMRTGGALERAETVEFLALAREAGRRALGLRAFDEQLVAGCALLSGHAVEMDTGEGKTLVGALAAAGHAMAGRRVHVLSVNDYLAERDAGWMRPFFELLGVTVGWVGQRTAPDERRRAYECDVVYAPVSEIGFDVLRDRFATSPGERVGPVFDAAVVDEIDAVMIDEAMVPLVLAGASDDAGDEFAEATALVEGLEPERDFVVDPDHATVSLTDAGLDLLEAWLGVSLYDAEHIGILTRINLALHARVLVHRDVDYLVDDGAVRLISASRGRVAHLQRWPDGLQAAIESKERLEISTAGVILDSITVHDLLLGYRTLSGMSGTVLAVAEDLAEFYRLPAGRVERHEPNRRRDEPDRVLLTERDKRDAIVDEVARRHAAGQPVLVGTQSVAESESLAEVLAAAGIESRVLNAKNDAEEAAIVARAGELGAVTISTQMSGRGTDIRLGGADERERDRVVAAGGLAVVAAGRYPSRRLDAQLRGRAGRQGDPGASVAFASVEDEIVRVHAPAHMLAAIDRHGAALPAARRRAIVAAAQAIAEAQRRDRHRATWAYNRAISAQRAAVLDERELVVTGAWDAAGSRDGVAATARARFRERIAGPVAVLRRARGADAVAATIGQVVLHHIDERWVSHLGLLQEIRDGIHLRALAGQRPEDEFHRIALREFHGFFGGVYRDVAAFVEGLGPGDIGRDLRELGLRRPSATWTYMVTDDPLGRPGDRLARELGRRFRAKVLRIE